MENLLEKRALIVDDNEDMRMLLDVIMKKEGWTTFQAEDGKKCLQMVEEILPDIILLDYSLPEMDGIEVLIKIKEKGYNIPVIVVTAMTMEKLPGNFFELGAFDFLSKPIKKADLTFSTKKAYNYKILWDRLTESKEKDYNFAELEENLERLASGDPELEMGKFILIDKQKCFALEEFFTLFLSMKPQLQQDYSTIDKFINSLENQNSQEARSASASLKNIFEDLDISLEKTISLLNELRIREEQLKNEEEPE